LNGAEGPDPAYEVEGLLERHWGLSAEVMELAPGSQARAWAVKSGTRRLVLRAAQDSAEHFELGLRASQLVDRDVLPAGPPVTAIDGSLMVVLPGDGLPTCLALLRFVPGYQLPLAGQSVVDLGRLLARIHRSLRGLAGPGAWTVPDGLAHSRAGLLSEHPSWVGDFLAETTGLVTWWLAGHDSSRDQMLRGDGPELLGRADGTWTGMIDWGAITFGPVMVDIGCWTAHLGRLHSHRYRETTDEFVTGYRQEAELSEEDVTAVPHFQRLLLSSRAPYQADPGVLDVFRDWIDHWCTSVAT